MDTMHTCELVKCDLTFVLKKYILYISCRPFGPQLSNRHRDHGLPFKRGVT